MGKLYNSTAPVPFIMQKVMAAEPIEDRMVVQYKSDLMKKSTWGEISGIVWNLSIYRGMKVLVVENENDPSVSNPSSSDNGLYYFKKSLNQNDSGNITSQLFDVNEQNFTGQFSDYWVKIGDGGAMVEVDNESIKFDPTQDSSSSDQSADHSDDNQIWVNQVNGGTW
jgi:hypothetical protein